MSWKNDLLVRKGGEFTIIWLLAHGKQGKRTKILNAVNDLDITEKCEALLKYCPMGQAAQMRNTLSLYTLGVLQYGIVVAFARKTELTLRKIDEVVNTIFKPPAVQKVPAKRGKRQNKRDKPDEDLDGGPDEQLIDLSKLPTAKIGDRYCVKDLRQITLAEYDQQPRDILEPDFRDFEQIILAEMEDLLEPASQQLPPEARDAFLNDELQSMYAELADNVEFDMINLDSVIRPSGLLPITEGLGDARDFDIQSILRNEEPMEIDNNNSLKLPELAESQLQELTQVPRVVVDKPPPRKRLRRMQGLIIDEETEFDDDKIRHNHKSANDLCLDRKLRRKLPKAPRFSSLMTPFPVHLSYGKEQFDSVFKDAVKIALRRMSTRGRNEQKMQEEHPIDQGGEELAIEQPVQYDEVVENLIRPFLINEIAERVPDVEDLYDIQVAEEYLDLNVSPKPEGNLDQTCFPARFEEVSKPDDDDPLLIRIKSCRRTSVNFMDIADKSSRKKLASDFLNLLYLLKRRVITAKQEFTYGSIIICIV